MSLLRDFDEVPQPAPYKVYLGAQASQTVQTYKEVRALLDAAPLGRTHAVYDANNQIVEEFVPY